MIYQILLLTITLVALLKIKSKIFKTKPTFQNKRVLITGASSGIGQQLARQFSALGAYVILCSRKQQELRRVQNTLQNPQASQILIMDMKQPEIVFEETSKYMKQNPKLDVLILNAGISQRDLFINLDFKVIEQIMKINYLSVVAMTKAVLPYMIDQFSQGKGKVGLGGGGRIAATSSLSGLMGVAIRTGYCGSKHAVHGFLSALRGEISQYNIKVSIISPGYVQTAISQNAVVGDGRAFGKTDKNIANGMKVDIAAKQYIEAVFNGTPEKMISPVIYKVVVLLSRISGYIAQFIGKKAYSLQMKAKEHAV